jgi:hypothetical protein
MSARADVTNPPGQVGRQAVVPMPAAKGVWHTGAAAMWFCRATMAMQRSPERAVSWTLLRAAGSLRREAPTGACQQVGPLGNVQAGQSGLLLRQDGVAGQRPFAGLDGLGDVAVGVDCMCTRVHMRRRLDGSMTDRQCPPRKKRYVCRICLRPVPTDSRPDTVSGHGGNCPVPPQRTPCGRSTPGRALACPRQSGHQELTRRLV